MRKCLLSLAGCLSAVLLLNACATEKKAAKPLVEAEDTISFTAIEPVKGRLNVYSSMARGVKYNVDLAAKNIHKKVFAETTGKSEEEILKNIGAIPGDAENPLYEASRRLDFAILYAISHLTNNTVYLNGNIYAKTAQNLALAAIKTHKDALFAERKIREFDRQISSLQKQIKSLNAKLSRNGVLSEDDLSYKKGLEVAVLKLQQLRSYLQASVEEYAALVKADAKKVQVEGRHFYELEDFDKQHQLETFQNAALDNRSEFNIARREVYNFKTQDVKRNAVRQYPITAALNLNGYDIKDPLYVDNLQERAEAVARNLVTAVSDYLKAEKPEQKQPLKANAFNELGIAVLVQVELDYEMVRMADDDYNGATAKVRKLKKEVRDAERRRPAKTADKIALLNKKQALYEQELLESQVAAERALALRALYFHAGLSPFKYKLIQTNVPGIEESLKISFNKDMIEMLARAEVKQKEQKKQGNPWAKENNWLEVLIDEGGPKEDEPVNVPVKPRGDFDPYVGEQYNKLKIMQLGSYRQRQNADIEWQMLQQLYPDFSNMTPQVESSVLNGKNLYRLILKSENGGFLEICNKLRADRIECILR